MKKVVKKAVKKTVTLKKKKDVTLSSVAVSPCSNCSGTGLKDSNTLCPVCVGSGKA